jgi:dihydroorotate dehydrogenase electron transfer subunit
MFKIAGQKAETPNTRTVRFLGALDAVPGQFVMVWVPGVDEFPMSVSYPGARFGITYQVLGDGTKALAMRKRGDVIGIRGPYGKGFELSGGKILIVTGGLGIAPVAPLIEMAKKKRVGVDLVLGARTKSELLFEQRSRAAGAKIYVTTDDGSKGFKGFASDLARELVEKTRYQGLYTCGPEKMIVKVVELAVKKSIPIQASLERIMKCGIGICDSCALDGMHVCKDGPVFSLQHLRKFEELGKTKLDLAGRKVPV